MRFRKKKEKILKDTSDWLNGSGIFAAITSRHNDVPWAEDNISGEDLDLDYYANRSGNKIVSNLVDILTDNEDEELSQESLNKLADIIYNKYHENWSRVHYALSLEYNPIWNKDYTETTDYEGSDKTVNLVDKTVTDTLTKTFPNYKEKTEYGKITTDVLSFPQERKTEITKTGNTENEHDFDTQSPYTETDELDFGSGVSQRKDHMTKNGTVERSTNYNDTDDYNREEIVQYGKGESSPGAGDGNPRRSISKKIGAERTGHGGNGYHTITDQWGNTSTKNRVNAFNGGPVLASDSTTYTSGEDGSGDGGGIPTGDGSGKGIHTRVTETGTNYDYHQYGEGSWDDSTSSFVAGSNPLVEQTEEQGEEKRTVKETGKKSETEHFTNYSEDVSKEGKETHTITKGGTYKDTETYNNVKDSKVESGTEQRKAEDDGTDTYSIEGSKVEENVQASVGGDTSTVDKDFSNTLEGQGNIGVTTTQQMLTQEIEFRKAYASYFDEVVFPDVDKVLVTGTFKRTYLY